jgi:hypothetical protein
MKEVALAAIVCGLSVTHASASHTVRSYTKKDGTYVPAHMSRDPGQGVSPQRSSVPRSSVPTAASSVNTVSPSISSTNDDYTKPILIFTALTGLGLWGTSKLLFATRSKSLPQLTPERQAAEVIAFFQEVDRNRGFQPIQVNDLQLSANEACVFMPNRDYGKSVHTATASAGPSES